MHEESCASVSLLFDVRKAHRRVPVIPEEWGRQACQVSGTAAAKAQKLRAEWRQSSSGGDRPPPLKRSDFTPAELSEDVYINKVGTFGVASAGYWWGRAGACLIRLIHYLQGADYAIWTMLYSDDGWLVGCTARYEIRLLLHFLILVVVGTPLAWRKLCGGVDTEWVGYALGICRFELGISEKRAQWVVRWCSDKARERCVRLGELREGLGRLQVLAGPLEHLRPFLGPLYAW